MKFARKIVQMGIPYICTRIVWFVRNRITPENKISVLANNLPLIQEVMEFLDGKSTVDSWLRCESREISNQYRIAIIDTLLARRGVIL